MDDIKHPTYGALDDFLSELSDHIKDGYFLRIGHHGALNWFAAEYSKLKPRHTEEELNEFAEYVRKL